MIYNFDEIIDRRGTNSYKWDEAREGELPLWVADMDFRVAQPIVQTLQKRVEHGVFGYVEVPEDYYLAVINWFRRRHQWRIKAEWMLYTSGVVPAVSATLRALTRPGDKVLIMSPVYNCFYSSIRNQELEAVECRLLVGEDGKYHIDWEQLERQMQESHPRVLLFCNPHNPGGRVWTEEELRRLIGLCEQYKVQLVSDEIHGDIVLPGYEYTPMGRLTDRVITLTSSSKAFNTAGLQMATIVCPDTELRERINRVINIFEICDVNPFGLLATQAAYNESEDWLDQLCQYLKGNYDLLCTYYREHYPMCQVMPLEGTYLAWVNIEKTGWTAEKLCHHLRLARKLYINPGTMYGRDGEGWIRWNLACPRSVLQEALQRFKV